MKDSELRAALAWHLKNLGVSYTLKIVMTECGRMIDNRKGAVAKAELLRLCYRLDDCTPSGDER